MDKKKLIEKLNMQRDILKELHKNPNVGIEVLLITLGEAIFISGLAIDVLEDELDEEED